MDGRHVAGTQQRVKVYFCDVYHVGMGEVGGAWQFVIEGSSCSKLNGQQVAGEGNAMISVAHFEQKHCSEHSQMLHSISSCTTLQYCSDVQPSFPHPRGSNARGSCTKGSGAADCIGNQG